MTIQLPSVSIIIPNHNHAIYLADAINSVLNQTCRDFEVIVVDDGSTDNSRKVIEGFGHRIRAIFQQNQGLSAARNTGIQASKGAYIGLLDADDMYESEFIGTLVALLEARPDAAGIYCGYRFVDHLNNPLPQVEARAVPPQQLYQALVDGNFLVPESMFVRRQCYETVGLFDTSLRALEDVDMWLRITSEFCIIHTTKVLTRHRVLPRSMSTDPERQFQNRMRVMKKHFGAEPATGGAWSDGQRRAYGRAYLASAVEFLQAHNTVRAGECLAAMTNAFPALLSQMETFFELGCGDQPKGYRGEFVSLNLDKNFLVVKRLLEKLFENPQLSHLQRAAYANLNYAFGLLAYGQRAASQARRFLFKAIWYQPGLMANRAAAGLFLRSLLGPQLVRHFKTALGRSGG